MGQNLLCKYQAAFWHSACSTGTGCCAPQRVHRAQVKLDFSALEGEGDKTLLEEEEEDAI